MHKILLTTLCLGAFLGLNAIAAQATVGQVAPNFTLTGADYKPHALSDYSGKYVVLEWTNPNCPFVHKFYDSGTMQALQKEWTGKGVVWLRINSSSQQSPDFQDASTLAAYDKANHVAATESLLDPDGQVGHTYGARTTPHMFVIDTKGTLIYAGGIDNHRSPDPDSIPGATNYVSQALTESMAGQPVSVPTAQPYGCSVKYAAN
jgi:peroxiredoxin